MEEFRGRVNMERLLQRKPLYPAERQAEAMTVCVTGAAGYIGSRIVARLLAAGHTVHATRRAAGDDAATVAALDELPGAQTRLHWFEADLMQDGSFDAAVSGCCYIIHSAGMVGLTLSPKQAYSRIIQPTLRGVENVLGSANRCQSVRKVVLTSSLSAVSGAFLDRGEAHAYSEGDWNQDFLEAGEPYFIAKVLAEWQAWSIAAQQDRWRLVAICPGHTYGPLLASSQSNNPGVASMKKLLDGSFYPFIAPLGLIPVDLDDVAAAHTLAAVLPQARGRYLVCQGAVLMTEVASIAREMYPDRWIPSIEVPFWAAVPILVLTGTLSYKLVRNLWNRRPSIDASRAQRELGLTYITLDQMMRDFYDRLLELGVLKRTPVYSTAPGAEPLPHAAPAAGTGVAAAVEAAVEATVHVAVAGAHKLAEQAAGKGSNDEGQPRRRSPRQAAK